MRKSRFSQTESVYAVKQVEMGVPIKEVAHKMLAIDSGHVCQDLYLACGAIGAGTCAVGAYSQDKMDAVLGVEGEDESRISVAPAGKVAQYTASHRHGCKRREQFLAGPASSVGINWSNPGTAYSRPRLQSMDCPRARRPPELEMRPQKSESLQQGPDQPSRTRACFLLQEASMLCPTGVCGVS